MENFFTYFLIEGFSILAVLLCAVMIGEKIKPFKWKIFGAYYLLAVGIEFGGHFLEWWTWSNRLHILHHCLWWATILTLDHYWLQKISKKGRFLILFNGIMTYQILQEGLVRFVVHYKLWGSEYNMVSVVALIVCVGCILLSHIKKAIRGR